MNVETMLVDALHDDSWGAPAPHDALQRIEGTFRVRRRRRLALGTTAAVVLVGGLSYGLVWLNAPQSASIRPAGPAPGHGSGVAGVSAKQHQAVSAAVQAAQQAAAAQYNRSTQHPTDCPTATQPVTPAMSSDAYQAVVTYNKHLQRTFNPAVLRLDRVTLAADDGQRGVEVTATCGPATAERTLVVYATRTDMGSSASLAEQVYFVSGTTSGLDVWRQAH
jgi:hypothetical protein